MALKRWQQSAACIQIALVAAAVSPWAAVAWLALYSLSPPVNNWHDDSVSPTTARTGDEIVVARSFDAIRTDTIKVTREMIRGDCKKSCDRVEMPSGTLTVEPGPYREVKKTFVIPAAATPGEWRLVFTVHWDDSMGRTFKQKLPELVVQVTK